MPTDDGTAFAANGSRMSVDPTNQAVAVKLDEVAALLTAQRANPFRVRAYHRAAGTLRALDVPISRVMAEGGLEAIEALPGIGDSLGRTIRDIIRFGYSPMIDRLRGNADPVRVLMSVPGIGRRLAERLHGDLHLDTLEDLEAAAHDARLATLPGFGAKRLTGVRAVLAARLGRVRPEPSAAAEQPRVSELLDVDREYRDGAAAGRLVRIAPKRFNPDHRQWLPILHTHRGPRHYTALFSNTAQAHRLGKTDDWVVIYGDHGAVSGQWTVVTARAGPLGGRRVVRGREPECLRHYRVPAGATMPG